MRIKFQTAGFALSASDFNRQKSIDLSWRTHFVTSDFEISAQAVADIYKRRWAVELLFRWLKGHLDIRRLPTKTVNAVKVQLAVAVMVQLLLQLKKIIDGYQGSLWQLLRQIRSMYLAKSLAGKDPPPGCRWRLNSEKALAS